MIDMSDERAWVRYRHPNQIERGDRVRFKDDGGAQFTVHRVDPQLGARGSVHFTDGHFRDLAYVVASAEVFRIHLAEPASADRRQKDAASLIRSSDVPGDGGPPRRFCVFLPSSPEHPTGKFLAVCTTKEAADAAERLMRFERATPVSAVKVTLPASCVSCGATSVVAFVRLAFPSVLGESLPVCAPCRRRVVIAVDHL